MWRSGCEDNGGDTRKKAEPVYRISEQATPIFCRKHHSCLYWRETYKYIIGSSYDGVDVIVEATQEKGLSPCIGFPNRRHHENG